MSAPTPPPIAAAPLEGGRPPGLGNALLAEWTKLRSLRSVLFTLLATVVLVLGLGALISWQLSSHYDVLTDGVWDPTSTSLSGISLGQLTLGAFGAIVVTGEFSTGMIRTTLTAVPRRGRLLAAKCIASTAVALVAGELTMWAAFLVGQQVIGSFSDEPTAPLSSPDVVRAVAGAGLYLALICLMATAIGALLRHSAGSIVTVVAIIFVLPLVLLALPPSWRNPVEEYWPTMAGSQIAKVVQGDHALSAWWGFGDLAAFVAVLLVVAYSVFRVRDV
ncbi:MAG TPA: ABC transporter permease [Acidimicrobiales bacterium]|nr:ABC transporter permease [Acidimicrobiales bacterium]